LTATYPGDSNYNNSSDTETHTVNKANTTTTITSDTPDPSYIGQSVTLNVTVGAIAPGSGTPTGLVDFNEGTTILCNDVPLVTGNASCGVVFSSFGVRTLTATYSGDANYNGSSDSENHTVTKATPTIIMWAAFTWFSLNQAHVAISATVSAPAGIIPTGVLTLTINSGAPIPIALDPNGSVIYTINGNTGDVFTVRSEYSGNDKLYGIIADPFVIVVPYRVFLPLALR
jgi:hypothetical protein